MRIRYMIALASVAVLLGGASAPAQPVSLTQAARAAAGCIGWPENVQELASQMDGPKTAAFRMDFQTKHGTQVVVTPDGTCRDLKKDVPYFRPPSVHLPPASFTGIETNDPDLRNVVFVLLLRDTAPDGSRTFLGMIVEINWVPQERMQPDKTV